VQAVTAPKYKGFYTVSEINKYIADLFAADSELTYISVKGEISNFTNHQSSGHYYFSIKDNQSKLNCVMFKNYNRLLKFVPQNGMSVIVRGYISVYQQRGEYQIYASALEKEGTGELYQKFLILKEKLEKKGYFDAGRKKSVPLFPRRVGIVTAPEGSVVCDIINILSRRFANMPILIAPAYVQGPQAAASICTAMGLLNRTPDIDVIILARGGGSLEELWPFNEEAVADAIYNSKKPVISAIGHQTDFTISDFVSDMRAPTPSAAAELVVFSREEKISHLNKIRERMTINILNAQKLAKNSLILNREKLAAYAPEKQIENYRLHLDRIENQMSSALKKRAMDARYALTALSAQKYLMKLKYLIEKNNDRIENIKKHSTSKLTARLAAAKSNIENTWLRFAVLASKKVLEIGYSLIKSVKKMKMVKSRKELAAGDKISIKFYDGELNATVDD